MLYYLYEIKNGMCDFNRHSVFLTKILSPLLHNLIESNPYSVLLFLSTISARVPVMPSSITRIYFSDTPASFQVFRIIELEINWVEDKMVL